MKKSRNENEAGIGVIAVARAFAILDAFKAGENALSLGELSRRTGLHKTTVLRIARTIAGTGYMVQLQDGAWRLDLLPVLQAGGVGLQVCPVYVDVTVQPEGKGPMAASAWVNGARLEPDEREMIKQVDLKALAERGVSTLLTMMVWPMLKGPEGMPFSYLEHMNGGVMPPLPGMPGQP